MADEMNLGEVVRRLEDVRRDCKEDMREARQVIQTRVSMERYQFERAAHDDAIRAIVSRVQAMEEARERENRQRREETQRLTERRAADRRLIFTAIAAPVLMLFLQLYLSARGAGQ